MVSTIHCSVHCSAGVDLQRTYDELRQSERRVSLLAPLDELRLVGACLDVLVGRLLLCHRALERELPTVWSVVVRREDASVVGQREQSLDRAPQSGGIASREVAPSRSHVGHEDLLHSIQSNPIQSNPINRGPIDRLIE